MISASGDPAAYSVARACLLALLVAAPLAFGAVDVWMWAGIVVLAVALLLCWATGCLRERTVSIVWTPLYIPVFLFMALGAAQLLFHRTLNAASSRDAMLTIAADVLILFLAANLFAAAPRQTWDRLGWTVAMYAMTLALFAVLQFLSGSRHIYWTISTPADAYIFGPYVSHNNYAGLMEMLIPLSTGFLMSQRSHRGRYLLGFAVLLAIASLVISGSRGGITAMVVEMAIFAGLIQRANGYIRRMAVPMVALVAAAIISAVWIMPTSALERFQRVARAPEVEYGVRNSMSRDAVHIARDHPLIGTGLGSFRSVYPIYQSVPTNFIIDYAHNDYAQALAETGLAGASVLLSALVLFFAGLYRLLRMPLKSTGAWIRASAGIGCCGLLVHCWLDFNLHIPANAAWFAFLVGITQCSLTSPEYCQEKWRFAYRACSSDPETSSAILAGRLAS